MAALEPLIKLAISVWLIPLLLRVQAAQIALEMGIVALEMARKALIKITAWMKKIEQKICSAWWSAQAQEDAYVSSEDNIKMASALDRMSDSQCTARTEQIIDEGCIVVDGATACTSRIKVGRRGQQVDPISSRNPPCVESLLGFNCFKPRCFQSF